MNQKVRFDGMQRNRHKLRNAMHSLVLLGLMFAVLGVCAWLFAGWQGLVWSLGTGATALLMARHTSPGFILSLYAARQIPASALPEAHAILQQLTARAHLQRQPGLYLIPTPVPTAFSVGNPSEANIALSHGLLRLLGRRELAAVMAHEVGHIHNRDLTVMLLADLTARMTHFVGMAGLLLILFGMPLWFAAQGPALLVPGLVMFFAPLLNNLLQLGLSRTREFDADLDAATLTRDPAALASALQRIELRQHGLWQRLVFGDQGNAIPSLLRTHPTAQERIDRLRTLYRVDAFDPVPAGSTAGAKGLTTPPDRPRRRLSGLHW